MRWRPLRILAAAASLTASFTALDRYEKHRATHPPPGWSIASGEPMTLAHAAPAVGTSAWRVGPDTRWTSAAEATQLYIRPELRGALGLTLAATSDRGTWVWVTPTDPVSAQHNGESVECMGSISPPSTVEPLALTEQAGSLQITWGEQRMVCPASLAEDRASGGVPSLQTTSASLRLQSIGRNKQTDGVPLSPLWWMSGLMVGGLLGMLSLDLLLSILARIRPARARSEE